MDEAVKEAMMDDKAFNANMIRKLQSSGECLALRIKELEKILASKEKLIVRLEMESEITSDVYQKVMNSLLMKFVEHI